jgi:enoyl-CoA hydratase/carnithine racemase
MSPHETGPVIRQQQGFVGILTLNRPAQRNALIWESWEGLETYLDKLAAEPDTRCIVLTGGKGFFSAGGDRKIGPSHGDGPLSAAARLELAHRVLTKIQTIPVPVIAAVEGGAIGIAWSLTLSCDITIAARDAYFSAPFVQLGLPPDGGLAWLLAQRLGRAKTAEIIFTSSRMSAPDAAQAGLITTVTEPGQALPAAITLATQIATANRHAIELSKRLLAHTSQPGLQTYQALELALAAITQHTTHPSEQHIATPTTPQPQQPQEPATLPTTHQTDSRAHATDQRSPAEDRSDTEGDAR